MQHAIGLQGYGVRLEPLARKHLNALQLLGNDPSLWEFTFGCNPFTTDADAQRWLEDVLADPDMLAFAIVDESSGKIAGSTRYLEISQAHRKLEIGWTFLGRSFWRTHVNTAAKLLLLQYAFEEWNALRVQFKAEAVNTRSRSAILRLGATYEGTLRSFRIRSNGEIRDTSFFSVIRSEWPAVKERLLSFLERSLYNREAG
jgi:RimJ/RimL family protein N-acetyltransferase